MNIAIVEDFITDIKRILGFFKQYDNSLISNLNVYKSGEDFLESANLYTLDVVFLDIYMEKLNGMDVAEKIRKVNETCQIIFVTTSADFAVKSYEVRAFDYLLKPVTFEKFSKVMKNLEKNMKRIAQSIVVKTGRTNRKLFVSDI
ncbi:MAG: response regulator, partial [Oscillospiraceae bacterium]